jgi:menaquinone-specific isochorismate synthase
VSAAAVAAATRLAARTEPVDGPIDLAAFAGDDGVLFERDGAGIAGRGVALVVRADEAADALAAIDTADEVGHPGCGPVAIGALPFDPSRTPAGTLVVPAEVLGRDPDGTCWRTAIGPVVDRSLGTSPIDSRSPKTPPDGFRLTSPMGHDDWCRVVGDAVDAIGRGELAKVVLARQVVVEANRALAPSDVVGRLRALYPSCTAFSVDGFVGASPELLVSRRGAHVVSHPLAGTVARSGDPDADDRLAASLLRSTKDREEHRFVVDAVAAALRPRCEHLDVPDRPTILSLRNVSHLGTHIEGRLLGDVPSALELALLLHPTPAVAGVPTAAALDRLRAVEGFDRGRYAGPVGWVDRNGDGTFVVGIRSAELSGSTARLFAGVGIVEGSEPQAELAETQLKLQALLAAVVRP